MVAEEFQEIKVACNTGVFHVAKGKLTDVEKQGLVAEEISNQSVCLSGRVSPPSLNGHTRGRR
jgi:hypothetical protein